MQEAVKRLDNDERDLIERLYFLGESTHVISRETGRPFHLLRSLHERSLKRLRGYLAGFVRREFGIAVTCKEDCPICGSDHRRQIDKILRQRDPTASWGPVLLRLREEFNLTVSAALLIGHEKYH